MVKGDMIEKILDQSLLSDVDRVGGSLFLRTAFPE